ncbi:MAG: calcium/sodium antiporter [Deltaproteobacteria bacterium]|nr:calcium/sodium antiporter [Deltaproteobacteria bacterium]
MVNTLFFLAGLTELYFGADWLVKGASRLAVALNVQPLVVGLTVVAFGTSLPEFVVSFIGALKGLPDIALGNIVGSNIVNIGLILGLSAIIFPLSVHMRLIRFETPFMIFAAVLLFLVSLKGIISRIDGILFIAAFTAYIAYTIKVAKKEAEAVKAEYQEFLQKRDSVIKDIILIIAGLAVLIIGAEMLVRSAVSLARAMGISELIIGMTIVAAGTSLPEFATSTVAAFKKEADISIGNIVGSNIFNILFILGVTGIIQPIAVNPEALKFHMPVIIFFSLIFFVFMSIGSVLSRLRGALLVLLYIGYVIYITTIQP